jgi:hypothetical protein
MNAENPSPTTTCRVIGIRPDGSRITMANKMQPDRAKKLKELLEIGVAFLSVEIEPGTDPLL